MSIIQMSFDILLLAIRRASGKRLGLLQQNGVLSPPEKASHFHHSCFPVLLCFLQRVNVALKNCVN